MFDLIAGIADLPVIGVVGLSGAALIGFIIVILLVCRHFKRLVMV